jgi:hypothetical protein
MAKSLVLLTFAISLGCVGGKDVCIDDGTAIAITRADPTGTCGSDVVAGVTALTQMFTPQKDLSCGVTKFMISTNFTATGSGGQCSGSDAVSFQDLGSDGGTGSAVMTITCAGGVSCTESFDETWTAQ